MTEFPCKTAVADQKFVFDDDPSAESCPDEESDGGVESACGSCEMFAELPHIAVIAEFEFFPEAFIHQSSHRDIFPAEVYRPEAISSFRIDR